MMTSEGPSSWASTPPPHVHHQGHVAQQVLPRNTGLICCLSANGWTVITPQQSPTLDKKKTEQSTTETISDDISTKGIY